MFQHYPLERTPGEFAGYRKGLLENGATLIEKHHVWGAIDPPAVVSATSAGNGWVRLCMLLSPIVSGRHILNAGNCSASLPLRW